MKRNIMVSGGLLGLMVYVARGVEMGRLGIEQLSIEH